MMPQRIFIYKKPRKNARKHDKGFKIRYNKMIYYNYSEGAYALYGR